MHVHIDMHVTIIDEKTNDVLKESKQTCMREFGGEKLKWKNAILISKIKAIIRKILG